MKKIKLLIFSLFAYFIVSVNVLAAGLVAEPVKSLNFSNNFTGAVEYNSNTYYVVNGVIQTGLVTVGSDKYYFDSNGKMVKGQFITINGKLYYFGKLSGTLQKTGWYHNQYYFDKKTGEVYTGLKEIDGINYYFNAKGVKQIGLVTVGSDKYYFDVDGKMVKGQFIQIDGKLYYFGKTSGTLQKTGWYHNQYYFDKQTGEVYTGLKEIDGKMYMFDYTGLLLHKVRTTEEMTSDAKKLAASNKKDYEEVTNLTNSYRSEIGVKKLVLDNDLTVAATMRAIEMGENDYYSHTRPNGTSCFTIIYEYGLSYSAAGENIAMGTDWYFTADIVSGKWKNSPGHYANMTDASFNKIGIGKYTYGGYTYWVQLFTD